MADRWSQYIVDGGQEQSSDRWSQYAIGEANDSKPTVKSDAIGTAVGVGLGIPAAAAGAVGAYKVGKVLGRGATFVGRGIANIPKVTNPTKGASLAEELQSAFVKVHTDKVKEFGSKIDELSLKNPNRQVSLKNFADSITKNIKDGDITPEAKSIFNRTPVLRDMIGEGAKGRTEITARQAQDIINYMNTKVPRNIRFNNLDVVDAINDVRSAQLEAFPEMESIRKTYSEFKQPYEDVKKYFKFNRTLSAIKEEFGGAQGQKAVEKILPKEVINKIGGYRAAAKLLSPLKSLSRGLFGVYPAISQAIAFQNDPQGVIASILGMKLAPKGTEERDIQTGRLT